ncbi:MAG: hypothetical protein AAB364_00380 [Patescibacteria group bacterium]
MIREFAELTEIEIARANVIRVIISEDPSVEARFRFRFGRADKPNMGVGTASRLKVLTRKLIAELDLVKSQADAFVLRLYNCPEQSEGNPLSNGDFERLKKALKSKFD